jgi:hypothetical protein
MEKVIISKEDALIEAFNDSLNELDILLIKLKVSGKEMNKHISDVKKLIRKVNKEN